MLFAALVSNLLEGESENAGETGLMIPYVGFITLTWTHGEKNKQESMLIAFLQLIVLKQQNVKSSYLYNLT